MRDDLLNQAMDATMRAHPAVTPYQKRKWRHVWNLFPRMVDVLPEGVSGNVEIRHFDVSPYQAYVSSKRRNELWTPGRFCQLTIGGVGWMYDTYHERIMNEIAVTQATGDVLIGGLGLGMILHPILAKPEVCSVTVLENSEHVAALVMPSLDHIAGREKLRLQMCDATQELPAGDYDAIWLDCVPCYGYGGQVLEVQESWISRFLPLLRPAGWIGHWGFEENLRYILDQAYARMGKPGRKRAFPMGKTPFQELYWAQMPDDSTSEVTTVAQLQSYAAPHAPASDLQGEV